MTLTAVSLWNQKTILKFYFLRLLNFGNWYFVSGIEGLQKHNLYM